MEPIYHIAERALWEAARGGGEYRPPSLEREGYVHFSRREQVRGTLDRFYRDRDDLIVLEVDPARLGPPLVDEAAGDGAGVFPHLYGPLEVAAVVATFSPSHPW
jgi:uncharacterized protein (DUF952 family)